jgi:hypothetical protein
MQQISLNKKEVYKALTDEDTFATVLHAVAFAQYGEEIYKLDSLELYARLQEDFGAELVEDNESKLMAMIVAVSTPYFFQDINVFKTSCEVFTSGDAGLTDLEVEEPTLLEVLWGLYEVGLNAEEIPFHAAVERYLESLIDQEAVDTGETTNEILEEANSIIRDWAVELNLQLKLVGFKDLPKLPPV